MKYMNLEEYIRQGEPQKREKGIAWQTAIGLQEVDGLKPSEYLRTLGFEVNNDTFAAHSWYFRNALVRANYNNIKLGVTSTNRFLEQFFRNLLMNEIAELKNRELHIEFKPDIEVKSNNGTVKLIKETRK